MSTRATVDDIVEQVQEGVEEGQIDRLDDIARRLIDAEAEVTSFLGTIRKRRHMMFHVNTSSIGTGNQRLQLSVRVHGVQCGKVDLRGSKDRPFTPHNHESVFEECWETTDAKSLPWTHPSVRSYLEQAEKVARTSTFGTREAAVQAATIRSIRKDREQWRHQALVRYPARTNKGVPYQLPVPIKARGGVGALVGDGAGHTDLLTRKGLGRSSRLRVLELKAPGATDVSTALDQAVTYAAALRTIMDWGECYPRLLGYPNYSPPLEATAVVADSEEARAEVEAALESLSRSTATLPKLRLSALFYRWEPTASGQIEVTHELRGPV